MSNATPKQLAEQELSRLEALRADWQQRRTEAAGQVSALEGNAGALVLNGSDPQLIAMDLAGARAAHEVAGKTLETLEVQIRQARGALQAAQAEELQRQVKAKEVELRRHQLEVDKLLTQLEKLDGCAYAPVPFRDPRGYIGEGAPPLFSLPKSRTLQLDIESLRQQAQSLATEAQRLAAGLL